MVFRVVCCCLGLIALSVTVAAAQDEPPDVAGGGPQPGRLRVFLDCGTGFGDQCFSTYMRDRIAFVDFVRQAQDAEVHVLATGQATGGGGRQVVLRFVGRERFLGHDHDLRALTLAGDTENTRREVVYRTMLVGLLDYVAHDGIPPGVNLSIQTEPRATQTDRPDDPWNLWVFSARLSASFDADERSHERQDTLTFTADRVTEGWKIAVGSRWNENVEEFDLEEGEDEPFTVTRRDRNLNWFLAKSLTPHWSLGGRGRLSASTFSNNRRTLSLAPAIEFSLFPYEDYATRQLRFEYNVGVDDVQYEELTIFEKLEEVLWRHQVQATLDQRQPWGTIRAGIEWSQYLHDWSKYRLEGDGNLNLRLTRGLSLTMNGSASRIRNQLSLPLRDATDEEVLLRIRQIQSGFSVRFNIGVTYTFGSLFNNVVNPRFGT